jgi:hypothetical protein
MNNAAHTASSSCHNSKHRPRATGQWPRIGDGDRAMVQLDRQDVGAPTPTGWPAATPSLSNGYKDPWRWSFHPFFKPFFATSTWSVTTLRHWLAVDSTGHLEIPRAHSLIVTVHCICPRFHHHLPCPTPTAPDHATTGCWSSVSFLSNGVCHWWRVV